MAKLRIFNIIDQKEYIVDGCLQASKITGCGDNRLSAQLRKNNGTYFAKFSGWLYDRCLIDDKEWEKQKKEAFGERIVYIPKGSLEEQYFYNLTTLSEYLGYKDIPTLSDHVNQNGFIKSGYVFKEKNRQEALKDFDFSIEKMQKVIEFDNAANKIYNFESLGKIPTQPGIYQIINKTNGKSYIGQSLNVPYRLRDHRKDLKRNAHANYHLQQSYNIYGENSFVIKILLMGDFLSDKLLELENYFIEFYETRNEEKGYNIA